MRARSTRVLTLVVMLASASCSSAPAEELRGDVAPPAPPPRNADVAPSDAGAEASPWYDDGSDCAPEGCALTPVHVTAGSEHTCVVMKDGSVRCWGNDAHGELGGGSRTRAVTGLPFAVRVGAGDRHSCALVRGGVVWCWGANDLRGYDGAGQLGLPFDGTDAGAAVKHPPAPVPTLARDPARALFVGPLKNCIVVDDASRRVRCFGANHWGELDPSLIDVVTVAPSLNRPAWAIDAKGKVYRASTGGGMTTVPITEVRSLAESIHDAGLFVTRSGEVRTSSAWAFYPCVGGIWKNHALPRPGIGAEGPCPAGGPEVESTAPPALPRARAIAQSIAGLNDYPINDRRTRQMFACAIREDERVACWGQNARGQLGIGTIDPEPQEYYLPPPRVVPIALEGIEHATEISVGGGHACALTAKHELFCWGVNGPEDRLGTGAASGERPRRVSFR